MHLAQTHDGPCFEPHVTVLVFEAQDEAEALQVLTLVADRAQVSAQSAACLGAPCCSTQPRPCIHSMQFQPAA